MGSVESKKPNFISYVQVKTGAIFEKKNRVLGIVSREALELQAGRQHRERRARRGEGIRKSAKEGTNMTSKPG